MSAKSTPQILSLNEEYTFLLLKFLIIGLWSSSAHCSFSIPDPNTFLDLSLKNL